MRQLFLGNTRKNFSTILLLIILMTLDLCAKWSITGKREISSDTSTCNSESTDTLSESPYLKSLRIQGDSIIVDERLYRCRDKCHTVDYYILGKYVSRKDANLYQDGYIPRSLFSGMAFPVGGPVIVNNVLRKKEQPKLTNTYKLPENDFKDLEAGYIAVFNRKRILKSAGLGTIGSVIGVCLYLYIAMVVSDILNPVPME